MKKLLLVDDSQTVLLFEKMILSKMNFLIDTACDGKEALEKIEKNRPDLILLDLKMPGISGLSFCKILRNQKKNADIPIIVVTTVSEKKMVEECMKAGCNDYVLKPFKKNELVSKIQKYL